ncbi:MAG: hypothetical protein QXY15_09285 [Candidatus Nitrosotenuis sp.]
MYFAFIFAAVNTLTTTYFLAIERYPLLKEVFPTFIQYVVIVCAIGIPILVSVGYMHFKKSGAFRSETDITIEANPHQRRILLNTETLLVLCMKINEIILKLAKNEKLSEDELKELAELQKQLNEHLKNRTIK